MKKALTEGFWIGIISILVLMSLMVWTIVLMTWVEEPVLRVSMILFLMMAIPMTLSVLEYKQKNLLDEALTDKLKKDTES